MSLNEAFVINVLNVFYQFLSEKCATLSSGHTSV